jgi:hypothetical protein
MEVTLLNKDQIFGNQIDIIKKYGSKSCITDFSILLDGFVLNNHHVFNGFSLKDRTGMWITKSSYDSDNIYIVDHRGCRDIKNKLGRQCGGRPVLLWNNIWSPYNDIYESYFGEYPQTVVGVSVSNKLSILYDLGELEETGKIYTLDSSHNSNSNAKFMARYFIEYELNGHKYIRFLTDNSYCNGNFLSDGRKIYPNSIYWVSVEPITWIVDNKNNIALSKNILLSGIQYNNYDKDNQEFEDSDIYNYLNKIFLNDIVPSKSYNKQLVKIRK